MKIYNLELLLDNLNWQSATDLADHIRQPENWLHLDGDTKTRIQNALESFYRVNTPGDQNVYHVYTVEQNHCYDHSKACNGGGYSQPYTALACDGYSLFMDDTSCGDYGTRYDCVILDYAGIEVARALWGSMHDDSYDWTTLDHNNSVVARFINKLEELGYNIPYWR